MICEEITCELEIIYWQIMKKISIFLQMIAKSRMLDYNKVKYWIRRWWFVEIADYEKKMPFTDGLLR